MTTATLATRTGVLPGLELPAEQLPARATAAERAAVEWRLVAQALSPRAVVRLAVRTPDGKKLKYPGGLHAEVTEVPSTPAALYVFGDDGCARMLPVDLDAKGRHSALEVAADAAGLRALLTRIKGRWIEDEAPGGGRHILIPWSRPQPFADINRLGRALARRMRSTGWYGTIDSGPFSSVTDSLIRPPGSPHRLGGFQQLVTPLNEAASIASVGNGAAVWNALHEELAVELAAVDAASVGPEDVPDDVPLFPQLTGRLPLSPAMDAIARTGEYDRCRYASGSEARIAVLINAVARGWSMKELIAETVPGGRYAKLAGFYERYSDANRLQAWAGDWLKAYEKVAEGRKIGNSSPLDQSDITGGGYEAGGAPGTPTDVSGYRWLRSFLNAVSEGVQAGELSQSQRLALRALAVMGMRRGGVRQLRIGIRGLDLTSCLDHSTIADALRVLRDATDPFVELLEAGTGVHADWYELKIPIRYADAARWRRWAAGRLESTHHVFRDRSLGAAAGLVYDVLPHEPVKTAVLAAAASVPDRTVRESLTRLAAAGLAEKVGPAGWRRTGVSLDAVAAELGADEAVIDRVERYRAERVEWHAFLRRFDPGALEDLEHRTAAGEAEAAAGSWQLPDWLTDSTPKWITDPRIPAPEPPDDLQDTGEPSDDDVAWILSGQTDGAAAPSSAGAVVDPDPALLSDMAPLIVSAAAAQSRPRRESLAQKRWRVLDDAGRTALTAFYFADQDAEKAEARRRGTGQHSPPARVWRAVKADEHLASAATGGDPEQLGHIANRLSLDGLVEVLIVEMLDGYDITVTLTNAGRAAAREGLGVKLKPRPAWALSAGYWRELDRVARAAERGRPHAKVWEQAIWHLGPGAYGRRGRGLVEQREGRWYLTDAGAEHHGQHADEYRLLYPLRW